MRTAGLSLAVLAAAGRLSAAAADSPMLYPHPAAPAAGVPGTDGSGLGAVGLAGALLAAAGGCWLLWNRRRGGAGPRGRGGRLLSVAETRPLGNRQYLVVAAYGRKRFLLGVCQSRIELLSPLDDDGPGQD
jgi:flagellar protein FliO/FliZ